MAGAGRADNAERFSHTTAHGVLPRRPGGDARMYRLLLTALVVLAFAHPLYAGVTLSERELAEINARCSRIANIGPDGKIGNKEQMTAMAVCIQMEVEQRRGVRFNK